MKENTRTKRMLSMAFYWFVIATATYLFLSLCNWNLNLANWTGFSRFILGAEGVVFLIQLVDA
jgi:hypothetical protein